MSTKTVRQLGKDLENQEKSVNDFTSDNRYSIIPRRYRITLKRPANTPEFSRFAPPQSSQSNSTFTAPGQSRPLSASLNIFQSAQTLGISPREYWIYLQTMDRVFGRKGGGST